MSETIFSANFDCSFVRTISSYNLWITTLVYVKNDSSNRKERSDMQPIQVSIHESDEAGNVFTLLAPIVYEDLVIPAGFESDGASVPRFFWRCVFPPNDTRALRAAFIHDYVYRVHPRGWTKKKADQTFYKLLRENGIGYCSAKMAYWGVRGFGAPSWKAGGHVLLTDFLELKQKVFELETIIKEMSNDRI